MCVICYTNEQNITDKDLQLMWDENPMGAGFAWVENGQAYFSKGFMTLESLVENLPEDRTHLMIHFRISTGGNVDELHCHPYDINNVMNTEGKTTKAIFHNGWFAIDWNVAKDDQKLHNDTFLLTRDILPFINSKNMYDVVLSNLDNSKFALFDATIDNDSWLLYGKWVDYKGMTVSNLNFTMPKVYQFPLQNRINNTVDSAHWLNTVDDNEGWDLLNDVDDEVDDYECLCAICNNDLDSTNRLYGVCDECTVENGLYCMGCEKRMGEEVLSGVLLCHDCK